MFMVFRSRKQAKLQWLQDANQNNVDKLNSVRCEASRYFRNKKEEYLKAKIDDLVTNCKIKKISGLYASINDFTNGY